MKDEIVLNNLGLIHKVIKDMHCIIRNQDEFDEYYSAGLIGLIIASKTYDETKGKSGYLYRYIAREIRRKFAYNQRSKRYNGKKEISIYQSIKDEELIDFIPSTYNLEKEVVNKVTIHTAIDKMKDKRYKTYIIEYYGIGCPALNINEIAQKYGVSKQAVKQMIQWGLRLLRKELK